MRRTALSLAVSCIILASCAQAAQPVPKTEDDKALYNLGVMLSRSIQSFNFTAQELELVKAGLADGAQGRWFSRGDQHSSSASSTFSSTRTV